MRRLGHELGVEAMSLYNHVANKEDLLDGIADILIDEIEVPADGDDWKAAMRRRAISAHEMLARHPWAAGVIESRTNPSPARSALPRIGGREPSAWGLLDPDGGPCILRPG